MPVSSYSETARRVFAPFLRSSFEKLPTKIVEEIAESSPDPYYAILYYAVEKEKPSSEQIKGETLDLSRPANIYWYMGRAIERILKEKNISLNKLAEILNYSSHSILTFCRKVYRLFPDGVPFTIQTGSQLRKIVYGRKEIGSASADTSPSSRDGATEGNWDGAISELVEIMKRHGKPIKNEVIDEVALRHNVSPNGLKNRWAVWCKQNEVVTMQQIIENLYQKLLEYEEKMALKEREIEDLLRAKDERINELQSQLTMREVRMANLEKKIAELTATVDRLRSVFNQMSSALAKAISA